MRPGSSVFPGAQSQGSSTATGYDAARAFLCPRVSTGEGSGMPRRERSLDRRPVSITAAAKNYSHVRSDKISDVKVRSGEQWQHILWDCYDLVPEFHQGCSIVGALLSKARLYIAEDGKPSDNPVANAALEELFGGPDGQVEMLRQFGTHFTVAGEGWLFGPGSRASAPDQWQVAAATKVAKRGSTWRIGDEDVPGRPLVIRMWLPHPQDHKKADPDVRSALSALTQIVQLDKRTSAQIDSRLTSAGVLLLPSETEFPATVQRSLNPGDPEPSTTDSIQNNPQGLADLLFEVAQLAIQKPESAAARLPIIGMAPGEYLKDAKFMTFWSELDKVASKTRREKLESVATAMRVPIEVLLSSEGSNHWNMWLADENNVKIHGEPLLTVLTGSLNVGYLWPALKGEPGIDDPRRFKIMADTSKMRLRPNRSKEALELNDRLILSDEATLRENGFDEADRMDKEGVKLALLRKVASGSTTPEIVEAGLRQLGIDLQLQITDSRPPAEARPTPSLQEHPVREIPQRPGEPRAATALDPLVLVAEQLVDRALQRAGNRLKVKLQLKSPTVPANRLYLGAQIAPADIDDILQDAWASVRDFDYGIDPVVLERTLDMYTRALIRAQRRPSRETIAAALQLIPGNSGAA